MATDADIDIVLEAFFRSRHGSSTVAEPITEAVASTSVLDVGSAPAASQGMSFSAFSQALTGAAHQAAQIQEQANQILQTSTTVGVGMVYDRSIDCSCPDKKSKCTCSDPSPRRPVPCRPRRRRRR